MPQEMVRLAHHKVANKTKEETYYKCTHCGDEIFWNTHRKLTYCKCKKIWIDACLPVGRVACPSEALAKEGEDYVRVGGNEGDYSAH